MKAVVFDRDGTLIEHVEYPNNPDQVKLVSGAERLWDLKRRRFKLFLYSNQSGVGRGLITEEQFQEVHREFTRQIGPNLFDGSCYAKELPSGARSLRKPDPMAIQLMMSSHDLYPHEITMIGDSHCDAMAAHNAGIKSIIIQSPRNGDLPRTSRLVGSLNEALDLL